MAGRASDNYQHKGVLGWEKWKKVSKKKQGSFLKGTVLSEADMNFSGKLYRVCDIYTVLNSIAAAGAVIIAVVVTVKATPVVLANLKGIAYYCEAYGIKEGLDMYSCMGLRGVPESIVSIIQMDLQDGKSDVSKAVQYADDVIYAKKDYWAEPGVIRGKK